MKSVAQTIEKLIHHYVDSSGQVEEYDASCSLSPFLAGSFVVYRATVLSREVFFAACTDDVDDYGSLRRRLDQLTNALGIPQPERVILFITSLPASVQRYFLETGTPFATATGDIFIPYLSFRVGARRRQPPPGIRRFRSSDQSIFLFGLYADGGFTQADVMDATGHSLASVSRALANLVAAQALDFEVAGRTGRKKTYYRTSDEAYVLVGLTHFGEAVRSVTLTDTLPQGVPTLASVLSALSLSSDLIAPKRAVWAVGPARLDSIVLTDPNPERGFRFAIQTLNFDQAPFAHDGRVDPFTMLLTIGRDERGDERVRIALREALRGCTWYQD